MRGSEARAKSLPASLGYRFRDSALLRTALTHRSYGSPHNERLEFLGDSILNCVVADELYRRFPGLSEGELSRARAMIVRQQTLVERAEALGLGAKLKLGEGESKSGGAQRPSILANALEAIIGAVYLDGGFEAAHALVCRTFAPLLDTDPAAVLGKDAKTLLQEYLQARHVPLPRYKVVGTEGEAHAQRFTVECLIAQLSVRTVGQGANRRAAEQQAARAAYEQISAANG